MTSALFCWIVAAAVLPCAMVVLLLISLVLSPRCQPGKEAVQVDLDKLISISQVPDFFLDRNQPPGECVDRIKKRHKASVDVVCEEDATTLLVMAG